MKTLLVSSLAIAALLGSCAYAPAQKLPDLPAVSPLTLTGLSFFQGRWDEHPVGSAFVSGLASGSTEFLAGRVCFYGKRMNVGQAIEDMRQTITDYPIIANQNLRDVYRQAMLRTYPCQP